MLFFKQIFDIATAFVHNFTQSETFYNYIDIQRFYLWYIKHIPNTNSIKGYQGQQLEQFTRLI